MNAILAPSGLVPFKLDLALYGLGALVLLVFAVLLLNFGMIYIRALFSGAKVTITELVALRLRRIPVALIVDGRITAVKSGLPISIDDLSTHFLAGGNVQRPAADVFAMISPPASSPPFLASLLREPPKSLGT